MSDTASVTAETNRLLGGRTRDIQLSGAMLALYRERTWPQRAKIVRAWMVWVGVLNMVMVGVSAVLTPQLIGWSAALSGLFLPLLHGLGWLFWRRRHDHRLEALSLVAVVLGTMLAYGCFGTLAGGGDAERYLTGALFMVTVALVVFDIGLGWTLAMGFGGLSLFLLFLVFNPALALPTAAALTLFYGMGLTATLVARRTATILAQKSFLMSLRDRQRSEALAEANARLEQLATTDTLTGLANRRSANAHIGRLWDDPGVAQSGIAFIMADIDHFKQLNDTLGHAAGDDCIRRVAAALRDSVRAGSDIVSRYGGEEFLVVLCDATPALATGIAERMRCEVEKLAIPGGLPGVPVTISLGIACARNGAGVERWPNGRTMRCTRPSAGAATGYVPAGNRVRPALGGPGPPQVASSVPDRVAGHAAAFPRSPPSRGMPLRRSHSAERRVAMAWDGVRRSADCHTIPDLANPVQSSGSLPSPRLTLPGYASARAFGGVSPRSCCARASQSRVVPGVVSPPVHAAVRAMARFPPTGSRSPVSARHVGGVPPTCRDGSEGRVARNAQYGNINYRTIYIDG